LHASVMDNLTLGASIPHGLVHEALEWAHAAEFVAALPEGLETIVGELGAALAELKGDRAILLVSHHADYLQISDSVVTLTPSMTHSFAGSS
jgi:ATP-binding cassette, subfamily C, bacterial